MLFRLIGAIWKKMPRDMRRWVTRRVQSSFTVSAAGIITNERGEVLLLNHFLRPHSGWGLPGGFLNTGEQPEAAFRREIREEVGIELSDVKLAHTRTLSRHIEIIYSARGIGEASVKSREIIELGWFEPDNIPDAMGLDRQFITKYALTPANSKNEGA